MPRTLPNDVKLTIGRNLVAARDRLGWTQRAAAKRAGVRVERLNKWEKGKELIGTEGLILLATAYNRPVDAFLSGADEAYDAIIEGPISLDVKQHYQAKVDTFIRRTTVAMQLALEPGEPSRTAVGPAGGGQTGVDRSKRVHARRKRKPPKW